MSFFALHWRHLGVARAAPRRASWERLGCSPWPWPGPGLALAWPWSGPVLALALVWPWASPLACGGLWLCCCGWGCGCRGGGECGWDGCCACGRATVAALYGGSGWRSNFDSTVQILCKPSNILGQEFVSTHTHAVRSVCFLSKTASGVTIFFCFLLFSRKALDGKK